VDTPRRRDVPELADLHDSVALYTDVGAKPRRARTVDHARIDDQQVEDREQRYHGASSVSIRRASSTVAGWRPMSRAIRTALATTSPLFFAISSPSLPRWN